MAKDRFSPVNEVAEISSPITSPGRPECAEQPTDDIAVSAAGQTSVQTDQSHGGTEVTTDQGEVIEAVSVPEISETAKESSEQDQPTEEVSNIKGESSLVETKAHENRKSVESPSQDEVTFCTNQSKADESADHNCECICTCTRPIPLPQEGISYIASRNFLEEQGADLRSKQSHEKRTYIIGQLPKAGSSENVFDYSGLIAELPRLSGTHKSQSFYTSHQQAGLKNTAFIPTITKTVGPIVQWVSQPARTAHTATTMSGSIQPANTFTASFRRSQEREELQQLNDRFAVYVQQVRQLGQEFSQLDSSAFLRSCRLLEDQIQNIKNLYEKELDNVRLQLEEVSRERNQYKMEAEKNQMAAMDLQTRFSAECNKSTKLTDDLNSCHRQMMVLEQEVAEYRSSQHAVGQAQQIQRDLENLNIENQQLRGRYEQEHISCQEAHDRVVQSDKKLEFDRQVNQAAVTELKERLEAANTNILSLETRLREVSQPGGNLGDMLQKVREAAAVELQKYQAESEDRFNRNITNLRAQAEEDSRRISSLRLENEDFLRQRVDFENQIRSLQAKLNSSDHQVQTMKETLAIERTRYGNQVASMDRKARQLQDLLLDKMHEANVAREMQVPLKAEIEAFKVLLEDEERRLQHSHGSAIHTPDFNGTTASHSQAKLVCSPAVRSFTSPSPSQPFPPVSQSPSQPYPQSSQSQASPHHTHPQSTVYPPASQSPHNPLPIQSPNFPYVPNTTAGYTSQGESYQLTKGDTGYNSQGDSFVVPTAPLSVHIEEPHDRKHPEVRPGSHTPQQTKPSVYTYQTNPSVNKLNLEHEINQRVGPITRAKSAPATRQSSQLVSANLGEGRDYFDEMFIEGKRGGNLGPLRPYSSPVSSCHDYNTATVSSIGELKVLEVNQDGKYVRLVNTGETDAEIGGHMIQQNVGGHPVAVYRFKPHTRLAAHKTVTVWSGLSDPLLHQPPTDFVWREQQRWGTGPECTTILCRPNGQAIAWTTAAHRFARNPFEAESRSTTQEPRMQGRERDFEDEEVLTELHVNGAAIQPDPVFLKREKQTPPSLSVTKHPHGSSPKKRTHPQTRPERPWTSGNDNSSVNRQSRSQTCTPDHPKGQPYAGPLSHKVGGSVARSYAPPPGITMNGSGRLANQATDPGVTSMPPSAFMKPRDRFDVGLTQVQSQHHNYNSPMPRPPLHSAW